MLDKRVLSLNGHTIANNGPVVYWMSRDQRVQDNWALVYAQQLAKNQNSALMVIFCLFHAYPGANARHFNFMIEGLKEVETSLRSLSIPFFLLRGNPLEEIVHFTSKLNASVLITDFDPLRIKREWKQGIARQLRIPFYEVDAHNIVPCFFVSDKAEFGAYTLRPKIQRLLNTFLIEFMDIEKQTVTVALPEPINWEVLYDSLPTDRTVSTVSHIIPGARAALGVLGSFIENKLETYNQRRNDPMADGNSGLSPYLHFGQISSQRIALEVLKTEITYETKASFLEELIVRKELADNFCYYNANYDKFDGFPEWARKSLNEHRCDKRDYIYSPDGFERAETHDMLWNACQNEMVTTGKMHGYMRMYWAKKILEWTPTPEEALQTAIYLNDKYSLDGRDPNGYAGCAWSVGGVHDRAWGNREVFGKIRYMNDTGCKRKFDVKNYIKKFSP